MKLGQAHVTLATSKSSQWNVENYKHPTGFPSINGVITHPDYVPEHKREEWLGRLRSWCQQNPERSKWPQWLVIYANKAKKMHKHAGA